MYASDVGTRAANGISEHTWMHVAVMRAMEKNTGQVMRCSIQSHFKYGGQTDFTEPYTKLGAKKEAKERMLKGDRCTIVTRWSRTEEQRPRRRSRSPWLYSCPQVGMWGEFGNSRRTVEWAKERGTGGQAHRAGVSRCPADAWRCRQSWPGREGLSKDGN